MASTNWIYFPVNTMKRSYVQDTPGHRTGRIDYLFGPILIATSMWYLKTSFFLDYEQSLFLFRFSNGSARETRAARKSWILDSGSFVTGTWIPYSNRKRDPRFLELNCGFQSLRFRIWQAKSPVFRNLDYLKWGDFSNWPRWKVNMLTRY